MQHISIIKMSVLWPCAGQRKLQWSRRARTHNAEYSLDDERHFGISRWTCRLQSHESRIAPAAGCHSHKSQGLIKFPPPPCALSSYMIVISSQFLCRWTVSIGEEHRWIIWRHFDNLRMASQNTKVNRSSATITKVLILKLTRFHNVSKLIANLLHTTVHSITVKNFENWSINSWCNFDRKLRATNLGRRRSGLSGRE